MLNENLTCRYFSRVENIRRMEGRLLVLVVRLTTFDRDPKFNKAVKDFGPSPAVEVLAVVDDFEFDWRSGMEEDQLFARYDYKPLRHVHRPYKLFQIYAGPKRKNLGYRAELIFYDEKSCACWVHAFKKDSNPKSKQQEINFAVARADECWYRIKGVR